MDGIKIGNRMIGATFRTLIVAEIGINHDGQLSQALDLIEAAAEAGADAVKFQLFRADEMYHPDAGHYETASGEQVKIRDVVRALEVPPEWMPTLQERSKHVGLLFFATVTDATSLSLAVEYDLPVYKIASYDISHLPLLNLIARQGKPVILSTAGARLSDIEEAVEAIESCGNSSIALLHCVAKYPAPLDSCNLNVIRTLTYAFPNTVVGYSDHTEDPVVAPVQSVLVGAKIVEKHFTLNKNLPGPDHVFAVDPKGLKQMAKAIREAEAALPDLGGRTLDPLVLGQSRKTTTKIEKPLRNFAYRSIFTTRRLRRGEVLTRSNIAVLRNGQAVPGLHPRYYEMVIQSKCRVTTDVEGYTGLQWDHLLTRA